MKFQCLIDCIYHFKLYANTNDIQYSYKDFKIKFKLNEILIYELKSI